MFRKVVRFALAATSTALFIPYAIAFVAELMYGKPSKSYNRFLRALNPKRVYAFNSSLICELKYFKYTKLFIAWTQFYRNQPIDRLIKDIEFGQNKNALDVYKPKSSHFSLNKEPLKPVIVYLYGGSWYSGDKNIYGLLCSNLADLFDCIVVCPNYSIYPKGFVDDMVQDVSDALQWIQSNAIVYGGDKDRVALIGHSAGAHLAMLAIGELCRKYLDDNPEYLKETNFPMINDDGLMEVQVISDPVPFHETHFNSRGTSDATPSSDNDHIPDDGDIQRTITEPQKADLKQFDSDVGTSMVIIGSGDGDNDDNGNGKNNAALDTNNGASSDENGKNWISVGNDDTANGTSIPAAKITIPASAVTESFIVVGPGGGKMEKKDESEAAQDEGKPDVKDEAPMVKQDEQQQQQQQSQQQQQQHLQQPQLQQHQQQAKQLTSREENAENGNLLKSIKIAIGLAGVYDIDQHYNHLITKATEHFSPMSRVMYDDVEQFHNFSPIFVLRNLPENVRLPPIHLYHGSNDSTVHVTSSLNFGAALWGRRDKTVQVILLNGCDHSDIMFDLMAKDRLWFGSLVKEFKKGFDKYLY